MLFTSVNIFLVLFQGILTLEPLPTAVSLAYEPSITSAGFFVLFRTDVSLKKIEEEKNKASKNLLLEMES